MDADTRQKIIEELTAYLNRAPKESEIMNAQTDINIFTKVKSRQEAEKQAINDLKLDELSSKVDKITK